MLNAWPSSVTIFRERAHAKESHTQKQRQRDEGRKRNVVLRRKYYPEDNTEGTTLTLFLLEIKIKYLRVALGR